MPENGTIFERRAGIEAEIEVLKGEWLNIPDVIEMGFRLTDSRGARVHYELNNFKREMTEFKREMNEFRVETNERLAKLENAMVALPRLIIDMLDERDGRRR